MQRNNRNDDAFYPDAFYPVNDYRMTQNPYDRQYLQNIIIEKSEKNEELVEKNKGLNKQVDNLTKKNKSLEELKDDLIKDILEGLQYSDELFSENAILQRKLSTMTTYCVVAMVVSCVMLVSCAVYVVLIRK